MFNSEGNPTENNISLLDLLVQFLKFIKKNLVTLIVIGILTNIGSYVYFHYLEEKNFKSNMVIFTNYFKVDDISVLTRKLNYLIECQSYDELGKQLGISKEDSKKIKKINVQLLEFNKTEKEKSIDKEEEKFDISVTSTDPSLMDKIDVGFERYLKNDPFLSAKILTTKTRVKEMRERLIIEISNLDSLKSKVGSSFTKKDAKTNLFISSPSDINDEIIKLYEKKLKYDAILQFDEGFGILQRFSHNAPITNLTFPKFTIIVNGLGLILTLLGLFSIDFISKNI